MKTKIIGSVAITEPANSRFHDVRFLHDEQRQPERRRVLVRVDHDDQRPEEVLPGALEGEDRVGRQRRRAQRQHDAPEDPELAGAVDPGGVEQVVGDRQHVLPEQEDAEGADRAGHDQAPVGVEPAVAAVAHPVVAAEERDVLDDDVVRDQRDLAGHHHRRQEQHEDRVAAGKLPLGEARRRTAS